MMKFDKSGKISYLYQWGEGKATANSTTDACKAITYDRESKEIIMLLEASSSTLRPDYESTKSTSGAATDIVIIRMKANGEILGGHNINMYDSGISIQLAQGSFFTINGNYLFGAFTYGFKTRYQKVIIGADETFHTDSHLFNYKPGSESKCFYQAALSSVPTTKYTGT